MVDSNDHNVGQVSASSLCTLQDPYIVPSLVSSGFIDWRIFFDILLEVFKNGVYDIFLIRCKI